MLASKNTFWAFSLSFYAELEVQQACLRLQNNTSANVNILLYVLYQAKLGKQLSKESLEILTQAVRHWHEEIIQPIRTLRQLLKQNDYDLADENQAIFRKKLMALELGAEKLEQSKLDTFKLPCQSVSISEAAKVNLHQYASYLGTDLSHPDFVILLKQFLNSSKIVTHTKEKS